MEGGGKEKEAKGKILFVLPQQKLYTHTRTLPKRKMTTRKTFTRVARNDKYFGAFIHINFFPLLLSSVVGCICFVLVMQRRRENAID